MVTTTQIRKTFGDYLRLPDEPRVELFDGEFFMVPAPLFPHQSAVAKITAALVRHVEERRLGVVLPAPFDVVLTETDVVQPDVLFVAEQNRECIRGRLHGPPDLVVEVLSSGHAERDRIVKRDLYARAGVPEFWLVDTDQRTIEIRRNEAAGWRLVGIFEEKDELTSPTFPDLSVTVESLF